MDIVGIPADLFDKVEPLLRWHLNNFEERSYGTLTAAEIIADIHAEKRQAWMAWEDGVKACVLTTVNDGNIRVVSITHCAGEDRGAWQDDVVTTIENWARDLGATKLQISHRPGYAKFLRSKGFRETHRIMERNIGQ